MFFSGTLPNMQRHSGSSSSLNKMSDAHGKKSADFDHKHSSDQDLQNRRKFDQVYRIGHDIGHDIGYCVMVLLLTEGFY